MDQNAESRQKKAWVTDLELMHHYSTVVWTTLPRGDEVSHVWQIELAKAAFAHEPLLHQILAVSAFHLAYLQPGRRLAHSMLASQHQSDAAQGLRTALADITPDSCHPTFATASLLVIGTFAALAIHYNDEDGPHPVLDDMIDIFLLTRGLNALLHTSERVLQQGPFASLFEMSTYSRPAVFLEAICERLHQLNSQLAGDHPQESQAAALVECESSNFIKCIKESITSAPVPEVRVVMTWPMVVSEEFMVLLRQKNYMALTLFTYYCAILHESASSAWYTKGWGSSVAKHLAQGAPSPWREVMGWTLDYMGVGSDHGELTNV